MWRQCFRGVAHWWWVDALLIFDFVKKHNFVFRMRPLGGISQLLRSLTQRFANINFQFLHNPWCSLVKSTSWVSRWFPRFCKIVFWGRSNWMDEKGLCRVAIGIKDHNFTIHWLFTALSWTWLTTDLTWGLDFHSNNFFPLVTVSVRHLHLKNQSD